MVMVVMAMMMATIMAMIMALQMAMLMAKDGGYNGEHDSSGKDNCK